MKTIFTQSASIAILTTVLLIGGCSNGVNTSTSDAGSATIRSGPITDYDLADLQSSSGEVAKNIIICRKCGEVKGSEKCCDPNGEKCPKCGLNKDSVACCKNLVQEGTNKDVVLCGKCGEVKNSDKCCDVKAERCPSCGLIKGSPGCCVVDTSRNTSQTLCPIKGLNITEKYYTDYEGKRIYFCCPGCDKKFLEDPEKYMKQMKEAGIVLKDAPVKNK